MSRAPKPMKNSRMLFANPALAGRYVPPAISKAVAPSRVNGIPNPKIVPTRPQPMPMPQAQATAARILAEAARNGISPAEVLRRAGAANKLANGGDIAKRQFTFKE